MSDELGSYTFLSWLRRGLSTNITAIDDGSPSGARATAHVSITVGPGPLSSAAGPVDAELALHGPGDVRALDPRVVVRTWPRANVFEAEPNYFPLLELVPADLPWRYTPARANAAGRLRPWLCLIVLADDEIDAWDGPNDTRPVPAATVHSGATLPPLSQAWAWAHVQVAGAASIDTATALTLLDDQAHRLVARLLCPRKLVARRAYTAMLVPTLERARLAGLGLTVPDSVDGMEPAWLPSSTGLVLPVYHHWRFQTADSGDFEDLVRRIQPRVTPSTLGSRPVDVSSPGMGLPSASSTLLRVESALAALSSTPSPWDPVERATFQASLTTLLDRPADLIGSTTPERVVAPPLYGQWHGRQSRLTGSPYPWFESLNGDPRTRIASGLGTLAVQRDREALLASAWSQVESIRRANELLRNAQLAREAALSVHRRHVTVQPLERFLAFTAPVHARVKASPTTIRAVLAGSPLGAGVLHAAFRRVIRPRGPLGLRAGSQGTANILDRLNRGVLVLAPTPQVPSGMATAQRTGARLAPAWISTNTLRWIAGLPVWELIAMGVGLLFLAAVLALAGALPVAAAFAALGASLIALALFGRSTIASLAARAALRDGMVSSADVRNAPARPGFVASEVVSSIPPKPPSTRGSEDSSVAAFRVAAAAMLADFEVPLVAGPILRTADLEHLRTTLVAALDPRRSIVDGVLGRLQFSPVFSWLPEDPLEPIMAAPVFPQAMYAPLGKLSADWLFAGLDQVPQDTVTLLRTNQKFIEAFMVGLNHEMARVLLFNEYPTDQRGSYFRQFWDSSGVEIDPTTDPETSKDITPIHGWRHRALGTNSARPMPAGGEFLVLLLRAELLRRYPNTVVYAARARWKSDGTREILPGAESIPVFRGTLADGVGFYGFALTAEQVRGGDVPSADAGWFFVLQEHADENRFGLDVAHTFGGAVTSWNDLGWGNLANDGVALDALQFIDVDASLPDTRSIASSGGAVWHGNSGLGAAGATAADLAYATYQRPVRVAVHASRLVPTP